MFTVCDSSWLKLENQWRKIIKKYSVQYSISFNSLFYYFLCKFKDDALSNFLSFFHYSFRGMAFLRPKNTKNSQNIDNSMVTKSFSMFLSDYWRIIALKKLPRMPNNFWSFLWIKFSSIWLLQIIGQNGKSMEKWIFHERSVMFSLFHFWKYLHPKSLNKPTFDYANVYTCSIFVWLLLP